MLQAVLTQPRHFELIPAEPLEPAPGQLRLRLEGCGVCSSSLPVWQGRSWFKYPMPPGNPGHEGWGVVEAVGAGVQLRPGARVAALHDFAFVTHALIQADQVVELPSALDGKPFPGEALGCAMNIFRRCDIQPGQRVAMIGAGFLGALLIQLATAAGAEVTAFSRRPWARQLALEMGAVEAHGMEAHGQYERVIEAVGYQSALDLATAMTVEGGRLIIAGFHQDGPRQVDMQLWNWRGLDVINAHERDPQRYLQGIREAAAAVAEGRLNPWPLLQRQFPLVEINQAFELAESRPDGLVKVLICA
jgi:threonine dehydrogenase-like Zn-dependent dehydrogenase